MTDTSARRSRNSGRKRTNTRAILPLLKERPKAGRFFNANCGRRATHRARPGALL